MTSMVERLVGEHGAALLGKLTGTAGLSHDEAQRFLPAAGGEIQKALQAKLGDLDPSDVASVANIEAITQSVDIRGLAGQTGISPEKGIQGIQAILPMILGFLKDGLGDTGDLLGLLGGGESVANKLGSLKNLGKLFG